MSYMARKDRRSAIIDAAVDLVLRNGLPAATVRGIAQALDCSPGQIHHHFASADELRAEAMREVWRRIEPELSEELHRFPPYERLLVLLNGSYAPDTSAANPLRVVAEQMWREAQWANRMDVSVRQAVCEGLQYWRSAILDALRDGMEQGQFPKTIDAEKTMMRLQAFVLGFELLERVDPDIGVTTDKTRFIIEALDRELRMHAD